MARYYQHLDVCPDSTPIKCLFELASDGATVLQTWFVCPFHRSVRGAMNDQQLYDECRKTGNAREAVRARVKLELALDKEHPGVPYAVLDDGSIAVVSGVTGQRRAALRAAAADELTRKPMGFGNTLTVE